jgi:flagellar basal-body rod protein FlgF
MDHVQLLGAQTQRVMQRRMEASANNLANVSTNGFKADVLVNEVDSRRPARSRDDPHDIRFVRDFGFARDMSQGALTTTGEPFDVAISGEGFFMIEGPEGPIYTRDGAFRLSEGGQLVARDGAGVLDQAGAPIVFDPQGERPVIDAAGAVRVAGIEIARIGVVAFDDPRALDKLGDNRWSGAGGEVPFAGKIVQGALEGSNVNPVLELTRVIEISRAYESAARFVRNGDEMRQRTLERLGRA